MVDVEFQNRANHFVPLSLLKGIAAGDAPEYLTTGDVDAIKGHFHLYRDRFLGLSLIHVHLLVFRDAASQPRKVKCTTRGAGGLGRRQNNGG